MHPQRALAARPDRDRGAEPQLRDRRRSRRARPRRTYGVTDSMMMFKSSKVKKEAWQFLERGRLHRQVAQGVHPQGGLPAGPQVGGADPHFADDPKLKAFTDHPAARPLRAADPELGADGGRRPRRPCSRSTSARRSPRPALEAAAAKIDELLQQQLTAAGPEGRAAGTDARSDRSTGVRRSRPWPAVLLILPSLVFAFWIIGYPVYDVADTSMHVVNRFGQVKDFAGLANFRQPVCRPPVPALPVAHAGLDAHRRRRDGRCSPSRSR